MTFVNSAEPDQRSSQISMYSVCHSTMCLVKQMYKKKKNLGKLLWNKVFIILEHLSYLCPTFRG